MTTRILPTTDTGSTAAILQQGIEAALRRAAIKAQERARQSRPSEPLPRLENRAESPR